MSFEQVVLELSCAPRRKLFARVNDCILDLLTNLGRCRQRCSGPLGYSVKLVTSVPEAPQPHVTGFAADAVLAAELGDVDAAFIGLPTRFPLEDKLCSLLHRIALQPGHAERSQRGLSVVSLDYRGQVSGVLWG